MRCLAASIPGASSSRFSSSSADSLSQVVGIAGGFVAGRAALPWPGEEILAAARFAPDFVLLFLQAHHFRDRRERACSISRS